MKNNEGVKKDRILIFNQSNLFEVYKKLSGSLNLKKVNETENYILVKINNSIEGMILQIGSDVYLIVADIFYDLKYLKNEIIITYPIKKEIETENETEPNKENEDKNKNENKNENKNKNKNEKEFVFNDYLIFLTKYGYGVKKDGKVIGYINKGKYGFYFKPMDGIDKKIFSKEDIKLITSRGYIYKSKQGVE